MNPSVPCTGCARFCSVGEKRPFPHVNRKANCPLLTARSEPTADASFDAMRERARAGSAMATMTPMTATTVSSSMSVKPCCRSHLPRPLARAIPPVLVRKEVAVGDIAQHFGRASRDAGAA